MEKTQKNTNYVMSWIKPIAFAAVFVIICRQFIFSPIVVKGQSMAPTLEDQDFIIVSKLSKIERFDKIVFRSSSKNKVLVKRVIGVPGDQIEMRDDVLYVNGIPHQEEYVNREITNRLKTKATEDFTLQEITGEVVVPEGSYFVMGDNRLRSNDSRHFGFIKADKIIGESKVKLF